MKRRPFRRAVPALAALGRDDTRTKREPPTRPSTRMTSMPTTNTPEPSARLEMAGISKSFGGVAALRDVDFKLRAGEIHGLVGENGAGKSTLMKIIAGVYTQYAGSFTIDGKPVSFRSTRDALAAGIAMVHQELSTVPDLSVAENVFLGKQPTNRLGMLRWHHMFREARKQLSSLGIDVDPGRRIGRASCRERV